MSFFNRQPLRTLHFVFDSTLAFIVLRAAQDRITCAFSRIFALALFHTRIKILSPFFLLLALPYISNIANAHGTAPLANHAPPTTLEGSMSLMSYASLISILLTAVTVVLAATTIGLGVFGVYTIRDIRNSTKELASKTIDEKLPDIDKAIKEGIAKALHSEGLPTSPSVDDEEIEDSSDSY